MKTQHTAPADGISAWQEADNPCQLLFPLGLPRPRCRAGDEPPAEGTSPLRSRPARAEALLLSQGEALQGFNPRFLAREASTERCCHILMAAPARRAERLSLHTHTHVLTSSSLSMLAFKHGTQDLSSLFSSSSSCSLQQQGDVSEIHPDSPSAGGLVATLSGISNQDLLEASQQ